VLRPVVVAFLSAVLILCAVVNPVDARSRVVAKKTAANGVFIRTLLTPGHKYRIELKAPGRHPVSGFGSEVYTFQTNHRFQTGSKTLRLRGTTPTKVNFTAPRRGPLMSWGIVISARIFGRAKLTLRVLDLGKRK